MGDLISQDPRCHFCGAMRDTIELLLSAAARGDPEALLRLLKIDRNTEPLLAAGEAR